MCLPSQESVPLKGGRGSASMVQKCKLCSRENSIGRPWHDGPAHLVLICRVKSLQNVNFFLTDILGDTITPYNVSKRPRSVLRFFSFSFSNVASCLLGWRPRTAKPSRRWCSSSVEVWSPLISSHKWESLLSYFHNCPYELEEIKPRLCHHPWSQSHSPPELSSRC